MGVIMYNKSSNLIAILVILISIPLVYPQVKSSTILKSVNYEKLENNYYNFSIELISLYIPESKQNLKNQIETGTIDYSQIVDKFDYSPLSGQEVNIYAVDAYNPNVKEVVCTITTDQYGKGSCIGSVRSPIHAQIFFEYKGDETHIGTSHSLVIPRSISTPPFTEIVDPSWIVIFLVIGVLLAAMYSSGRDPTSILDITTPKVKGVKAPKVQKLKFEGKGKIISAVAIGYQKGKMDIGLLRAVNTIEKNLSPEEKERFRKLYGNQSQLALEAASKGYKVKMNLIKMQASVKSKLQSAEKAMKKLQELKKRQLNEGQEWRLREKEKEIDQKINTYTKQIKDYERDIKNLSSEAILSSAGLKGIDIEKFKEINNTLESHFVAYFVQSINNSKDAKIDIQANYENILASIPQLKTNNPDINEKFRNILQAKFDLERLYISEAQKVLEPISLAINSLSEEERKKYNKVLDLITPEKERIKLIKELYKNNEVLKNEIKRTGLDYYMTELKKTIDSLKEKDPEKYKEYEKFYEMIKSAKNEKEKLELAIDLQNKEAPVKLHDSFFSEVSNALTFLNSSIDRFTKEYEQYATRTAKDPETAAFKAIINFGVLSEKARDYISDIKSGRVPYANDSPELDKNSAPKVFDMMALKYDSNTVFDALYNAYISPFMKEDTVQFAKERLSYFEDKDEGRTVFDRVFDDIWYQRINPKEEYYNLDMKLIGYYGLKEVLNKMEAEKIALADQPDCDAKKATIEYIDYFIRTYSPHKLEYEEKKRIGYEEKKLIEYKKKKEIGYEEKEKIGYEEKKKIGYEKKKLLEHKKEDSEKGEKE